MDVDEPVPTLPTWDELTDRDKGAALLHVWKRDWEGVSYAISEYPVRYFDHPGLAGLGSREACDHAVAVTGGNEAITAKIGEGEYDRLYDVALAAEDTLFRRRAALSEPEKTTTEPESTHA